MSALTRILNNQIFSKTIIASQKIADGTITGSLFSSNVTVPGDFLITGNLFVLGTSAYTTIASTNTYVNDPLIVLNNGFAGTNTYDEGFIFNRGSLQNRALIWSEFFKEFRLIGTTETGTAYGNVAVSSYQNLHLGNITIDYTANITNLNATGFINTLGNVSAAVGVFDGVNTTGYINAGGNVSTPQLNAGQINTTGNVLATTGIFNALTVNGNETLNGYLNASGNVMAAGAIFNSSQINGNQSVTGYVNVTGNVLADAGTLNTLAINSSTNASDSSGSTGALQIKGGVSIAKDVWIGGNLYAANIIGVTANVITVQDPLLYLSPDHTFPYDYDIGFYSAFTGTGLTTAGNILQHTGIVRHNDTNTWTFASNLATPGGGHLVLDSNTVYDPIKAGNLELATNIPSTSSSTGALIVAGGAGIGGNLNIAGGNRLTLGKDTASGVVYPENSVQITANANSAARISIQNISTSQLARSEFIASADNGSNVSNFIFTGITSSTFNSAQVAPIIRPNDGYTLTTNNLVLSGGSDVVIAANGASSVSIRVSASNSNVGVQYSTESTTEKTGAFTVVGGVGIGKDLYVGKGATFNSLRSINPFQVLSSTSGNVAIFANVATTSAESTEYVVIGGGNTVVQPGVTLKVGSITSMMIPTGPTAGRPSSLFGDPSYDVQGMLRYNTTINNIEFYDGTNWQSSGSTFTVISGRQFSGNVAGGFGNVDGTNTTFTLQGSATTASTIISINGVLQFPTLAYSVTGSTLTFTEPPAPNDVIDARILTTTATVESIASTTGLNQFIADIAGLQLWTGTSSTTLRVEVNPVGDIDIKTGSKLTYDQPAVNIAANATPYVIATFSQSTYTSAKYQVQVRKDSTNFQSMEALVLTDKAGNAYVTTYGVVNNGTEMGTLSANVLSGNVNLWFTSVTNMTNANVKAFGTYII